MGRFPESCWAVLVDDQKEAVGHVALSFRIWHEDSAWQGICAELGVPSFGERPGEALDNVVEATICYLNAIEQDGERERIFSERNIAMRPGMPSSEEPEGTGLPALGAGAVSRLEVGLTAVG